MTKTKAEEFIKRLGELCDEFSVELSAYTHCTGFQIGYPVMRVEDAGFGGGFQGKFDGGEIVELEQSHKLEAAGRLIE